MPTDDSDVMKSAFYEVLDNQIENGSPPETKETLDRLMASGHAESVARKLIVEVIRLEILEMIETNGTYNNARYTAALAQLS